MSQLEFITNQLECSSLEKKNWIEEDFEYMAEYLKNSLQTGSDTAHWEQECESILSKCRLKSITKGKNLENAYNYLKDNTDNVILYTYMKDWLHKPTKEQ